jgi:DNA repair protein RadA/Sms
VAVSWVGRCPSCGTWGSLTEARAERSAAAPASSRGDRPEPIADIDPASAAPTPSGSVEVDRVLGGGLVPGSVTLVGGAPGIGKSTILLQLAAAWARRGGRCLYVSGEESKQQIRQRAERLGVGDAPVWLVAETSVPVVLDHVRELRPDLLVIDSVQTMRTDGTGAVGSVSQVRDAAQRLADEAKARDLTTILVGHVTKEGSLAGPRVLEHLVDTVVEFEGDRHLGLRLLRATKHRFGTTGELGVFEMGERGLRAVSDPSGLFLSDRAAGVAGSVVVPTVEGQRPLLVELQALTAPRADGVPRRSSHGLDRGRIEMVLAVLARRAGLDLGESDVFTTVAGGVKVGEPAADLSVALAVASSLARRPVAADLVAFGEVGLAGELRQVARSEVRLHEAARLGFRRAIVPARCPAVAADIEIVRVETLVDALNAAHIAAAATASVHPISRGSMVAR